MFNSVLVGTDGSPRAERAVAEAIDLAEREGAKLILVAAFSKSQTFWEPLSTSAKVDSVDLRRVAEQVLMRSARKAEERGVETEYEAREGDPADVILDVAAEREVDVIVVGNKGLTGARRYVLGSVPNKITHHADRSVLVVRTD